MTNPLKICDLGIRVGLCRSGQEHVKRLGEDPFYCDDCRFERVVPRLISLYSVNDSPTVAEMLQAFGMRAEAELLLGRSPVEEEPENTGLCSYTQLPVLQPCEDKDCPLNIPAGWANNCINKFRALTRLEGKLTAEHLATAFQSNRRRVQAVLSDVTCAAREELLRDVVSDGEYNPHHPAWLRELEERFQRPIERVLTVLSPDQLVDGYALTEDQRQYLNQMSTE